jgi:hypothetical protein
MLAVAEAPFFYATFIGILTIGAAVVLVPGSPSCCSRFWS